MNGPAQSRPSSVPVAAFGANQLVFMASLDGFLYAVNGETGGIAASHDVGRPLVASPSAMFTAFGGSANLIFALTRVTGSFNAVEAVNLDDPLFDRLWGYGAGPPYGDMGIVVGQPAVDYGTGPGTGRIYFATFAFDAVNTNTIWCLTLPDGGLCPGWLGPQAIGNVTTPVSRRGNRLYVGTDDGRVVAINTADGTQAWSTPVSLDGLVKGFITADRLTSDLYFATDTTVRAITDVGSGYADKWSAAVDAPSTPIYAPGDSVVYVGGKVGRSSYQLLRLGVTDGVVGASTTLGDGLAIVGSPTLDLAGGHLYVATEEGVVYCVQLP
jgi:outer membrane protein assembly factor BamB